MDSRPSRYPIVISSPHWYANNAENVPPQARSASRARRAANQMISTNTRNAFGVKGESDQ